VFDCRSHTDEAIVALSDRPARSERVRGGKTCIGRCKLGVYGDRLAIDVHVGIGNFPASVVRGSSAKVDRVRSASFIAAPIRSQPRTLVLGPAPPPRDTKDQGGGPDPAPLYSVRFSRSFSPPDGAKHWNITALRQLDHQCVVLSFGEVVLAQPRPQPSRLG